MSCDCCFSFGVMASGRLLPGTSYAPCAYTQLEEGVWRHYKQRVVTTEYSGGGNRVVTSTRTNPPWIPRPWIPESCIVDTEEVSTPPLSGTTTVETEYEQAWENSDYLAAAAWFSSEVIGSAEPSVTIWSADVPLGGTKGWKGLSPIIYTEPVARGLGVFNITSDVDMRTGAVHLLKGPWRVPVNVHWTEVLVRGPVFDADEVVEQQAVSVAMGSHDTSAVHQSTMLESVGENNMTAYAVNMYYVPDWLDT